MQAKWAFNEDGSIGQSMADMQDPDVRLFTETARHHNQVLEGQKKVTSAYV